MQARKLLWEKNSGHTRSTLIVQLARARRFIVCWRGIRPNHCSSFQPLLRWMHRCVGRPCWGSFSWSHLCGYRTCGGGTDCSQSRTLCSFACDKNIVFSHTTCTNGNLYWCILCHQGDLQCAIDLKGLSCVQDSQFGYCFANGTTLG